MKTLLFFFALSINILLCCYPFEKFAEQAPDSHEVIKALPSPDAAKSEREPISYSELLRQKAAAIQEP